SPRLLDIYRSYIYMSQVKTVGGGAMPRGAQIKVVRLRADKDGCLSGPAFSAALTAIWKESRERPEQQVTLLLLDIDNLHQLNTVHGREAGDRATNAA